MSMHSNTYRSVACGRATRAEAARLVSDAMRAERFVAGPGTDARLSFARRECPQGLRRAAFLAALPTVGVSLGLLLVRRDEQCTVQFDDSPQGLQAHLTGCVPAALVAALEQAAAATPASPASATPFPAGVADPWAAPSGDPFPMPRSAAPSAPPPIAPAAPLTARAPLTAPAPVPNAPMPAPVAAVPFAPGPAAAVSVVAEDVGLTVVRPVMPRSPQPLVADEPAVVLVPDWGPPLRPARHGVMGRDPQPDPARPGVELVTVADPDMSVSKTHLEFGLDADGFWVLDRHSTNGTVLHGADGRSEACSPGARRYVEPGSTVQLGARRFAVQAADLPRGVLPID